MIKDLWLEDLYRKHYESLYQLASNRLRMYVGHTADVQDVLQEVFLLADRKKIYQHENPGGWLTLTTVNLCKNYVRTTIRHREELREFGQDAMDTAPSKKHDPSLRESATDAADLMATLEQTLSPEDYKLICRYCLEGHELDDLAKEMGIGVTALSVRIFRIRARLKKILFHV